MDLIRLNDPLDLKNPDIKIYARNYAQPPSAISSGAKIVNSLIAEGCKIKGTIKNSVIFTGCVIEEDTIICDSIIMPNSVVSEGTVVCHTITGENCKIGANSYVGGTPEDCDDKYKITVVGTGKTIEDNQKVEAGEIV
jgi:glucose-1-phosphate adenylyltransferase